MAESCPIIIGTPESDGIISGKVEPSYVIFPTSEDFCNPSSITVIIYDGSATFNGQFKFGST